MSAMAAILKIYFSAHLHICSGYVTQVSDPWPVGLLFSFFSESGLSKDPAFTEKTSDSECTEYSSHDCDKY